MKKVKEKPALGTGRQISIDAPVAKKEVVSFSGNRKRTEGIMPLIQEEQMLLRMEEEEEIPLAEVRRDNFPEFVVR